MLSLVQNYRKRKAINAYVTTLGPALTRRYGNHDQYTVLQLRKTAQSLGLNSRHLPYAIALYRHEQSDNTLRLYSISQSLLDQLRREIADIYFGGDTAYRAKDVISLSKSRGWQGGASPNWMSNRFGKTSL